MLISLIRTIIVYFIIVFIVRLMGKRQMGELQPTELIITILISNIATLPLEDVDTPLFLGLIPIITLVILEVIISQINIFFPKVARVFTGQSMIVIENGKINQANLKKLRVSADDLLLQLRQQSIFDPEDVQLAMLETTGKLSIYEKYPYRNVTNSDMKLQYDKKDDIPTISLIVNGTIDKNNLMLAHKTKAWLLTQLEHHKVLLKDVYIMTINNIGEIKITKKE